MKTRHNVLLKILFITILSFIILGFYIDGFSKALYNLYKIQITPARLINDFILAESIGSALINSALVGLIGLGIILKTGITLGGPTFSAVLTIMGFGLFGKTPLNILPIIFGVFLAAKYTKNRFQDYIIIALFGTALGPVVSFLAFELGLTGPFGILIGIILGVITGFILPSLAVSMLHLHQGYNLYNMGLTCGFLGLFIAGFIKATGHEFETQLVWYNSGNKILVLLIPVLSLSFILIAFIRGKKAAFKSFLRIQKIPGRLPSDFMTMESINGALLNCGTLGILGSLYVLAVGGDFNGPVIGGLLTVMGFGTFGTNLKNSWPVVLGVIIASLIFGLNLNSPGPLLAAIFVTTLAPLAGGFGWKIGIIAGVIHLVMVLQTSSWYGGINLYNNGFAGGLTAALIVAMIQWYDTNKADLKGSFRSKK